MECETRVEVKWSVSTAWADAGDSAYCSTVLCLHNQLNLNLIFFIKKQCNLYSNFIKRYSHPKERNFYVINEEMSVISRLFSMQKIFFLF